MALFDRFGPALAGNGQGAPNPQQAQGSPNFQIGNWGNQPNFAGGMQQFLRPPQMGQPGMMPLAPGGPQAGGQPPGMMPLAPGQPPGMPLAPQGPVAGGPAPGMPLAPQQGAPMGSGGVGMMPTAQGNGMANMAGGMQPFLARQ
jgi:hypothetical protein